MRRDCEEPPAVDLHGPRSIVPCIGLRYDTRRPSVVAVRSTILLRDRASLLSGDARKTKGLTVSTRLERVSPARPRHPDPTNPQPSRRRLRAPGPLLESAPMSDPCAAHTTDQTGVQQNLSYMHLDDLITRTYVLPLLQDEATRRDLIEEHRRNPIGIPGRNGQPAVGHSPQLARVLDKLRRQPVDGKYVIVCRRPFKEYYIGVCSATRGEPVRILHDDVFSNEYDAEHAVFLRRVDELLAAYGIAH